MRFLHTMIRVRDVDESLDFWCKKMGLVETRRTEHEQGRFTLIFLAGSKDESRAKQDVTSAIWPTRLMISTPLVKN